MTGEAAGNNMAEAVPDAGSLRYGFLGVGVMNAAILRGLIEWRFDIDRVLPRHDDDEPSDRWAPGEAADRAKALRLFLSPRGRQNAEAIAAEFQQIQYDWGADCSLRGFDHFCDVDAELRVCGSNQEVVDAADVLFLGVRPAQAAELLAEVKFQPGQRVVNLVSTLKDADLDPGGELNLKIGRAAPIPAVSVRKGATIVLADTPLTEETVAFFARLGVAVALKEKDYPKFQVITGMMGPFFQHVHFLKKWLCEQQGQDPLVAETYLKGFFGAVAAEFSHSKGGPEALMAMQTAGGLNAQSMEDLKGTDKATFGAMDNIYTRLMGSVWKKASEEGEGGEPEGKRAKN